MSVPIGLTVAANAMEQVNPLYFSKPYTGKDTLPQVFTLATMGANFSFNVGYYTATGSTGAADNTWLSVSPAGNCCSTPVAITVSVQPAVTLAPGIYTGEILADNASQLMVIPVTLQVAAPTIDFFDNMAGQLSYYVQTAATTPPPTQYLQIRNAGAGTLIGP
ncbi:MAG: hypothetical protein WDO73_06075 [Ignavibacteriota bacterium]